MQAEHLVYLKAIAFGTVFIVLLAFALGTHPFKKKKLFVFPASKDDSVKWMAGDYYTFLRANILTCQTKIELDQLKQNVEGFYDKEFRVKLTAGERRRYYIRLHEAIANRELALTSNKIPALCKN